MKSTCQLVITCISRSFISIEGIPLLLSADSASKLNENKNVCPEKSFGGGYA
jgi:hypothetical protein